MFSFFWICSAMPFFFKNLFDSKTFFVMLINLIHFSIFMLHISYTSFFFHCHRFTRTAVFFFLASARRCHLFLFFLRCFIMFLFCFNSSILNYSFLGNCDRVNVKKYLWLLIILMRSIFLWYSLITHFFTAFFLSFSLCNASWKCVFFCIIFEIVVFSITFAALRNLIALLFLPLLFSQTILFFRIYLTHIVTICSLLRYCIANIE